MDNKDIHSTEDISALIQTLIEKAEKDMCEMCGMKLYKKEEGFILSLSKEGSGKIDVRAMVRRAWNLKLTGADEQPLQAQMSASSH